MSTTTEHRDRTPTEDQSLIAEARRELLRGFRDEGRLAVLLHRVANRLEAVLSAVKSKEPDEPQPRCHEGGDVEMELTPMQEALRRKTM